MNKIFILVFLVALAWADTYEKCEKDDKKKCPACKVSKKDSKACKADKTLACAALKKCYKDVDKAEEKAADAMLQKYSKYCPASRANCRDQAGLSCPAWARQSPSQCTENPDWMLPNCAASCCPVCTGMNTLKIGTCPKKDRIDMCVPNAHASCHAWATQASKECKKNPKWMHVNCMQSCCDTCKHDAAGCPTVKENCKNTYNKPSAKKGQESCVNWARNGECRANPDWMNKNCAKECCPICIALQPAQFPQAPVAPVLRAAPVAPVFGGYSAGIPYFG